MVACAYFFVTDTILQAYRNLFRYVNLSDGGGVEYCEG